jgi:hypothetical protein
MSPTRQTDQRGQRSFTVRGGWRRRPICPVSLQMSLPARAPYLRIALHSRQGARDCCVQTTPDAVGLMVDPCFLDAASGGKVIDLLMGRNDRWCLTALRRSTS